MKVYTLKNKNGEGYYGGNWRKLKNELPKIYPSLKNAKLAIKHQKNYNTCSDQEYDIVECELVEVKKVEK